MESFLSRLESFVDPFDLDLLQPHLRARVQRHAQRTAALYGLLTDNNNINNAARGTGGVGGIIGGGTGVEKASTLLLCGGSSTLGSRFPTIPLSMPGGGAGGGKDGTALRRLPGVGGDAANASAASAARRKEEEAKGGAGAASPMHKAATWSAGLSKLTSAREGSNSPSDFFKSGAALYVSWFGGGGGGGGSGGNSE